MTKAFAVTKEQLAAGHLSDAAAAAQVPEMYQVAKKDGGRELAAAEAHRIVALVSLGKKSCLFRLGNHPAERPGAIEELSIMLKKAESKGGGKFFPFALRICRCIAAVALDELAVDMCPTCLSAGEVRDHDLKIEGRQPMKVCPTCFGRQRRRYTDDERIAALARAWVADHLKRPESEEEVHDAVTIMAATLRREPKLGGILAAINAAKCQLIDAERVATEESARMVERW